MATDGRKKRDALLFPFRWFDTLRELDDMELRNMLAAICHYSEGGTPPQFKGAMAALWNEFRQRIDHDLQKYNDMCTKNRANGTKGSEYGKLGGRPRNPGEPRKTPTGVSKTPKTPDADADAYILEHSGDKSPSCSPLSRKNSGDQGKRSEPKNIFFDYDG